MEAEGAVAEQSDLVVDPLRTSVADALLDEGDDAIARRTFQQIARLSNGACCRFDASSAQQLRDLLGAVAVFAAGGPKALSDYGRKKGGVVLQITHQVAGNK